MKQRTALLVGAGGMGRAWVKNLLAHPQVWLAGWVDLQPDIARAAADELGIAPAISDDLERALIELRPDFVVDVTVPHAHHDVTITALRAGVPVLGEKPMADTLERARAMIAAAEQSGQLYMVSQNRRYNPQLYAFRDLIQAHVGTLGMLKSDFYLAPHFGGFRETMPSPLLLDMAIHTFDAARYLSDADATWVYCEEFNPPWSWYAGAASATALFEMTGGLHYTYCGSWCSEGHPTAWEGSWRAVGPGGTASWDGSAPPSAEVPAERTGLLATFHAHQAQIRAEASGIAAALQDFLHALETGATPMGECHDNIRSLAMVFAALESAQAGRRVRVEV